MPELLTLPDGSPVEGRDRIMIVRGDDTYAIEFGDLVASLQSAILLPQGRLLGRAVAGTGGPTALEIGTGVALAAGALIANGQDHVDLPVLPAMDINASVVVNAAGQPRQITMQVLKQALASDAIANATVMWLSGSGAPAPGLGQDFDYYWDEDTGDAYYKSAGVWTSIGNIKGPKGDKGDAGLEPGPGTAPYDVNFVDSNNNVWLGYTFSDDTLRVRNLDALGNITINGVGVGGSSPTIASNALVGNAPSDLAGPGHSVPLSTDFVFGAGRLLSISPTMLRNLVVFPALEDPKRDHGAVGDGTADDSAAVNAAVTAAIAAGTRFVQVDQTFNVPSLDVACGDVFFIGRGTLKNEPTKRKFVIPPFAAPPPTPKRTVVARKQMPVFTAAIRAVNAAKGVLLGDSVSTPGIGAVSATAALWQRLPAKIRADNPGAAITLYDRGIGGQRMANIDGLPDAFPLWYTDTNRAWLEYVRDLDPDFVVIQIARNDGTAFSIAALRSVLAKMALWTKAPDIILCNGVGDKITVAASGAAAFTSANGFDYASGAMRHIARALGLGLIDMARQERLMRFGFDIDDLPLLRDNALTGGTTSALKYNLTLPLTWPTACFDFGGLFYIGAGGWTTLGNELTFEIGSHAILANKGNRFRIARDAGTGQIKYRIEVTSIALGAQADWVFQDWTNVPGWIVGAGAETGFNFQVSGSRVYFEPTSNGLTGATIDRYTPGFYGSVPRVGAQFNPVVFCAAGSVSNVLKLTNGTVDGLAAGLSGNPSKPNLYMPQVIDADTGAPHPGDVMWGFLQPVIDALDFTTAD